jgi:DNA (cytosine-5)-methyltransferase 1
VENVISYYKPLISPQEIAKHYFWANFRIRPYQVKTRGHMKDNKTLSAIKGFDINDKTMLRNCTEPELGLHILNESKRDIYPELFRKESQ